jgi:ribose transport system substrate-binding protein
MAQGGDDIVVALPPAAVGVSFSIWEREIRMTFRSRTVTLRRRLLAAALLVVAAVLAACGSDSSSDEGSTTGATTSAKQKRIVFVLPSLGNQAFTRELEGARLAAKKDPSIDLEVVAPGTGVGQANTLIPKLQNALVGGADALVVNGGAGSPSLVGVLKEAVDQGTKLVTFDVEIPDVGASAFVNLDDAYTSALGGEFLKQQLPDGGELGLFACYPSNPVTVARVDGFYGGLEGWKGWNGRPVASADSRCDSATARTQMENMLTARPNLRAVYSTTDQDATGIRQALAAADRDLVFVAHDTSREAATAILEGDYLDADIANPFEDIGEQAVQAAAQLLDGEQVEPRILIRSILVTRENAQDYLDQLGG